jgi:hypothetical protein
MTNSMKDEKEDTAHPRSAAELAVFSDSSDWASLSANSRLVSLAETVRANTFSWASIPEIFDKSI